MRVTNKMISDRVLFNIQTSLKRIAKLHDQLSSGYRVRYPSDDAVVAKRASDIMTRRRELKQFQRNIDHVQTYVNAYDSALQTVSAISQRLRELLVRAANGTLSKAEREAIAEEIDRIRDNLVEIANTRIGNEYIFSGYDVFSEPVKYENNAWKIVTSPSANRSRSVSVLGRSIEYGVTAGEIFKLGDGRNVFQVLDEVSGLLRSNLDDSAISSHISNISLKDLSFFEENITKVTGKVGGVSRFIEMVEKRIEDLDYFFTEYLSKERDADITELVTDLAMQQSVLEAALKSASRVLQATLVDFVR
ncbi:flagellar hook-associated protein FlgL [Thermotoga neapolitana]|uniref:Flagellar hook-associated protein 3 n=1 Tax=Thermotoga neapolitana (strain ATCC 49049 / DSM 4359 / NBRC 107923 / NS-E) TaxID=309803 RepID=B9K753_THENN|nr:flagellar hook-associated protein FlgL [Thermotoga neapolitana]ACM22786.1 Flagellar hook-associated protein 3 [Thermotoga neapolitana DSM 4359]KFZ22406.1 flagellar hook-associated protein 3 [Thermotoga neapolitana LA10]HBF11709.1 flagellar hook-associated protein 3 [Thermotoga neapolitana]